MIIFQAYHTDTNNPGDSSQVLITTFYSVYVFIRHFVIDPILFLDAILFLVAILFLDAILFLVAILILDAILFLVAMLILDGIFFRVAI